MSEKQTITINGRHYDAHSGLAVDTPHVTPTHTSTSDTITVKKTSTVPHAATVHARTQRSHTLNRRALKRPYQDIAPAKSAKPVHEIVPRKRASLHTQTPAQPTPNRSTMISKFAPHPVAAPKPRSMDVAPAPHPHVVKAHTISKAKTSTPLHTEAPEPRRTSQEIKHSAMHRAIANTSVNHTPPKKRLLKRHPRKISIISASFALLLLGGYMTYLNMPSLSVRVAAAQAGINASYPNYRPDGYSLNGTVGYSQGKVTMKFASNTGPVAFTINQAKSNWDSTAVLDNYVAPRAGASYIPYTERGLTIYTYGNNAAWVNGGILYTIEGNAPLSSEQIRRIATSLI